MRLSDDRACDDRRRQEAVQVTLHAHEHTAARGRIAETRLISREDIARARRSRRADTDQTQVGLVSATSGAHRTDRNKDAFPGSERRRSKSNAEARARDCRRDSRNRRGRSINRSVGHNSVTGVQIVHVDRCERAEPGQVNRLTQRVVTHHLLPERAPAFALGRCQRFPRVRELLHAAANSRLKARSRIRRLRTCAPILPVTIAGTGHTADRPALWNVQYFHGFQKQIRAFGQISDLRSTPVIYRFLTLSSKKHANVAKKWNGTGIAEQDSCQ